MAVKNKVLGIGGATLIAISVALGAGHLSKSPAPIPVSHGICVAGKTDQPVNYNGKAYKKGVPCTAVVEPLRKPRKHH